MENEALKVARKISKRLSVVCKDEQLAFQESWWLIEKLTQKKKAFLLLEKDFQLSKGKQKELERWLHDRIKEKKPIQYILGNVPFCNIEIIVKPPVLIPRPETEEWCSWLIKQLKKIPSNQILSPPTILDIGAGSGCIALALAKEFPNFKVIGSDINPKAITLAEENKKHNKIENAEFIISDVYNSIPNIKFDMIISNPPYLSEKEWKALSLEVREWEDKKALVYSEMGIEIYDKILEGATKFLQKNPAFEKFEIPQIVLEIEPNQVESIKRLFSQYNFHSTYTHKDLEGKDRWIFAQLF